MINTLIYFVSMGFTYVFGVLSKKFKWNKELPIQFQNFLVGLIVFFIAWLVTKTQDITDLWNQVWISIGGSGTATLIYDTKQKMKGE